MFNPAAGRNPARRRRQFAVLRQALARQGWRLEATEDTPASLGRPYTALVACGGDGTVHALAQLAVQQPEVMLGVAPPLGTANIMAHALGCPRSPKAAAAWLTRAWQSGGQHLPLGVAETDAGARYFMAIAGVGYDAAIVAGMSEAHKRRWGQLAFAASAAVAWRRYFPAPLTIAPEGGAALAADGLLYGLTRYYAGRLRLGTPAAGQAIVLALRGAPRLLPLQGLALASTGLEHAPGVTKLATGAVAVPTPARPLQLDGEPAGTTPVRLSLHPEGILFLAPPSGQRR